MNIEITFINQSYDENNSAIVIFQKNTALNLGESPKVKTFHPDENTVAWKVLPNHGRDWTCTFNFPSEIYLAAQDSFGNKTPQEHVTYNQQWNIVQNENGLAIELDAQQPNHLEQIEVNNALESGSVHAQIYRDGKLLAVKPGIGAGHKVLFGFTPTIWIGIAAGIAEGEIIPANILNTIHTEIALTGMRKAKLIMRGGGTGASAAPYEFFLEPVEDFFL